MFQAVSTPDLALTGNSIEFYARTRSRPGTAMNVATAEPVFERMTKQGSATHLPSLFSTPRRSLFLPPRRTGSSTTIQSEPISRQNRSSVLRQKRAARILEAQRASVWPHNKKKFAAKTPSPTKTSPLSQFQIPTYDTLQRRFAEAANSVDVSRATLEQISPNLSPGLAHYEGEFFDHQRLDDDRLLYDSASTLINSPPPHYDTLIDELKLSLSRLEESVRRAQEPKYNFAQNGVAKMAVREEIHSRQDSEYKHRKSASVRSPQQSKTSTNGNAKSQVSDEKGYHEKHEGTSFIQGREAAKKDSNENERIQSSRQQNQQNEANDNNSPKPQSAKKSERAQIDTERTAALLEDFFNQNSRFTPPKESIAQSDRSNSSTGRNQMNIANERVIDEETFDHYKNNFGRVRHKSYNSNDDRSFIESETRSRVTSVHGRIINPEATRELENEHERRDRLNNSPSPKISATRSTDSKSRRRISTATLILRSSSRPISMSPLPVEQPTNTDLSESIGEFTEIINYLEQQRSKDEERRSEISARSTISSKSDVNTVKGSNASRASSARDIDSIVDEVIREKHVLIKLCSTLLQQVHDIGVQMNRYEHKTERRLQKLKSNVREGESISLNDQRAVKTLNGVEDKVSSSREIINEQISELKSVHAAEIDQMKSDHQRALEAQRLMYESALAELEKELGEVRERLAVVQESIARIPHSGRLNSRASAHIQTEMVEPETIDGSEQAIDSNKRSIDAFEEDKSWGTLTVEETAILADQYKEIQKEVQSLLSDHDELKTRLLNVVHEKELAEKELYNKDCEIARLRKQLQQIDEEQSELNTKLSADLAQELEELRQSNADLTDQMRFAVGANAPAGEPSSQSQPEARQL